MTKLIKTTKKLDKYQELGLPDLRPDYRRADWLRGLRAASLRFPHSS